MPYRKSSISKKRLLATFMLASGIASMLVIVSISNANAQMSNMNNIPSAPISMAGGNQTSMTGMSTKNMTNVVRGSETILFEGKTVPGKDYIHLYDTTSYHIVSGHVAKFPVTYNRIPKFKL